MRHAVVTDVHGNAPGLRAVLARAREQGVDRVLCLGDVFECLVSKRDVADHVFTRLDEVFDQDPAPAGLLDGALLVRGNQEERISALVPDRELPDWARPVLDAPLALRTDFAAYCHGHALPWREVAPDLWVPLDAEFAGRALVHGHHHRNALHVLPRTGRAWEDVESLPVRFGEPVRLAEDRRYLVNVGPVRGPAPSWAVVDEGEATVTFHRHEESA